MAWSLVYISKFAFIALQAHILLVQSQAASN